MRLQDIMTRDIRTITPNASATEARSAMRTAGVRHLVVVDKGDLVGIVSDRDLGGRQAANGRAGLTVAELMTSTVVTAKPETTIRQAANLLRGHVIGCLVIVEDDKPRGIVTTTDLLELLGRGVERPIERSTRWTLRARGTRAAGPTARHARGD
jgi:CBS domain-containing protein